MLTNQIQEVYELATRVWYKHVNTPGGHPGIPGPTGSSDPGFVWRPDEAALEGAIRTLREVLA